MPNYSQKEIVRLKVPLRDDISPHPILILSCEDCISCENGKRHYIGVMLTHSNYKNRFSFPITKEMIDGAWSDDWSQARCHILVTITEDHIADNNALLGKMKKFYFERLLEHINTFSFKVDK
jgi:hypothetical protein